MAVFAINILSFIDRHSLDHGPTQGHTMNTRAMRLKLFFYSCLLSLVIQHAGFSQEPGSIEWETFNGGYFTIEKPAGWAIAVSGECSTFSFIISDPDNPIRRIFYFGEAGPFYLNVYQKQIDTHYIREMSGLPIPWFDMPVVDPLTPENFFKQFYLIAGTPVSQNFIKGIPSLNNFEAIQVTPQQPPLAGHNAQTLRAMFTEYAVIGEGMFYASVGPFIPFDGAKAGAGTGFAYLCAGISSYKEDFTDWEPVLARSLGSLRFTSTYIGRCRQASDKTWQEITEINKTWNDISGMIQSSWGYKRHEGDVAAEKYSDSMLGKERVYDPKTGVVYEIKTGDYDKYDANREKYRNPGLQKLPADDWELWNKPIRRRIY